MSFQLTGLFSFANFWDTDDVDRISLKKWFNRGRRDLPWRQNPSPYGVWVSEVMLQQTQVSVVHPYYVRWMERFPTVTELAEASVDEVIKLWEGLGYYSRARNLHAGARQVVDSWGGNLPSCPLELSKIKGVGPYTVGAIQSFAFKQKAAAVDGNVMRVLARFYGVEEEIDRPATHKKIWKLAEQLIETEIEPWIVNEALIEMGATVCKRAAKCSVCPISQQCYAFQNGLQNDLPKRRPRVKATELHRVVSVIRCRGEYLLQKGAKGKVMQDLYEFPYIDLDHAPGKDLTPWFQKFEYSTFKCLEPVRHTFTRFRAYLYPAMIELTNREGLNEGEWISESRLFRVPFSSGHRKILLQLAGASEFCV